MRCTHNKGVDMNDFEFTFSGSPEDKKTTQDLYGSVPLDKTKQPVETRGDAPASGGFDFKFTPSKTQVPLAEAKMKEDPEGFWGWASLEGARTFFEAASLNLGDNAASAIVATYHAMNDPNPIEDTWKTYYDIVQADYRKGQDEYAQKHKTASTLLGVAGAIASPASYIKAPSTLAGMASRATVEGGIAGAGSAESKEEILGKAKEGALWAGSTSLGFGFLFKGLSRKNIERDLDSVNEAGEEVFTSITLAANPKNSGESTLQGLYRDIIAPTYLAKTVIRNQEDLIMNPLERRVVNAKENLMLIGKDVKANVSLLGAKFKESKEQMREGFRQVNQRIGEDITDAAQAIKANNEVLKDAARKGYSDFSVEMNQQIMKDAAGFREQVLNLSFPVNVSNKSRQGSISSIKSAKTPQEQYDLLDALWKDAGFESVKKNAKGADRFLPLRKESLEKEVFAKISQSDRLSARVGNKSGLFKMIDDNIGFISDNISKGRIKASTLMTYRNELAMKANSIADTTLGDADRAVLRATIDVIDDGIIARLPSEAAKKSFKADKEAWSSYVRFKDSVKARSKAGEFGMFEPKDYIDVLRKQSKDVSGKGRATLQAEAERVNARITENADKIKENAHSVMRDTTNQQIISLSKLSKQKKKQLEQARKDYSRQYKGANKQYEESINKAERGIEIQRLQTELNELEEHLGLLSAQRSQRNPSWFQSIAAVGLLGGFFVGGVGGAAGAAAIGTGVGAALASKTGQRAVAGQTGLQTAMRNNPQTTLQTSQLLGRVMAEEQVKE